MESVQECSWELTVHCERLLDQVSLVNEFLPNFENMKITNYKRQHFDYSNKFSAISIILRHHL